MVSGKATEFNYSLSHNRMEHSNKKERSSTEEHRLRLLRGAVCEYLDEELNTELLEDLEEILKDERDKFRRYAESYEQLHRQLFLTIKERVAPVVEVSSKKEATLDLSPEAVADWLESHSYPGLAEYIRTRQEHIQLREQQR